ncbi:MAG TPA: hypothetical protein PLO37_16890 [Candidatus Hydrogenedentes bacterium]|nr:hypothetical protein [Candidatus Hydrogenedentota bacterium]HPG68524.1 hypothetical protein [Candidatus Hydrogenedentota bacterium]
MKAYGITLNWLAAIGVAMCGAACAQDAAEQALRDELRAVSHRILFERYDDNNWELYIMNADGSDAFNLTQTPDSHELYPQASPDGRRICFLLDVERAGDTIRSVYYMNADGSGRTCVAEKVRQPCWSPDGKTIAFVKQEFDRFKTTDFASKRLYLYDLESGATTEHPNAAIEHLYNLSWAADGRWIVSTVHAGMGLSHGIVAIEIGGMRVVNLNVGGCRPCVSPDGSALTWSTNDHTIERASIDFGGDEPKVSNLADVYHEEETHLYHPDFSPDGKYITFSGGPGGRMPAAGPGTHVDVAEMVGVCGVWDVYLKRADGTGPVIRLTQEPRKSNKESEWLPGRTGDSK